MSKASVTGEEILHEGRFIALKKLFYVNEDGVERSWEAAVRNPPIAAVMILPVIKPDNEILIIRQFRPPAGAYVWETPAGLIDPGEDAGTAALRELAEETGYAGKLIKVLPCSLSTAGLSGEGVHMAFVEISGADYPPDRKLVTDFDESENIVSYRVKISELNSFLLDRIEQGDRVDSKLLLYSEIAAFRFGL